MVGFFWDSADVINMVISLCRGESEEALADFACAIPVFDSLLGRGGKWLKSAGTDLVMKAINKGEDLVFSLRVTYRAAADQMANLQKYLDDSSRFMYEVYGNAGNAASRISKMDDIADSRIIKLGGQDA